MCAVDGTLVAEPFVYRRTVHEINVPVARTMREYFTEKAKPSPDAAKLADILNRAAIDAAHEPAISARIRAISDALGR